MIRGLYLDQMHTYMNTTDEIPKIVDFVTKYRINDVAFYANNVIPVYSDNVKLLMEKLRAVGVATIRVAIGSIKEADKMLNFHNTVAMWDGVVLEREWWNTKPRDFSSAIEVLQYIQMMYPRWINIAAYIGRVEGDEMQQLVDNTDMIFIHSYVDHPSKTFSYGSRRYEMFKDVRLPEDYQHVIIPLFSIEFHSCAVCNQGKKHPDYYNQMCFLGKWMSVHNEEFEKNDLLPSAFVKVEDYWMESYQDEIRETKVSPKYYPGGFYYYAYTHAINNGIN